MPREKTTRNPLGSIFKRELKIDGKKAIRFDARKRYRDANGDEQEKFKRCRTHSEATTALTTFQNEISDELAKAKEIQEKSVNHTFFELCDYFSREHIKPPVYSGKLKIGGYKQELSILRNHLTKAKEFFGDIPLGGFNYELLRRYRENLAQTVTRKGSLPRLSTVNRPQSTLKTMLNLAIQMGWLEKNPYTRGTQLIKNSAETKRNRMLTFEEEVRLLRACTGVRAHLRPVVICALDTAMRQGEIFQLEWKNVDFNSRVIYMMEEFAENTKTGVEGIIPITPRLFAEFEKIKNKEANFFDEGVVFPFQDVYRSFTGACKEAKIDNLQFRDLRSTGATRMMLAGNDGVLVRKVTRHTQERTFREHYTNVDIENAQLIAERLSDFNEFSLSKVKAKENRVIEQSAVAS